MIWCLYCQATKLINRATFIIWLDGNKLAKVLLVGNRKTLFRQQVSLLQPWASEIQQSETTKGPTHYGLPSPSSSCLRLHLIIVKCTCIRLEMNSSLSLSLWLTNTCKHTHSSFWLSLLDAYIFQKKSNQMQSNETRTHLLPSPHSVIHTLRVNSVLCIRSLARGLSVGLLFAHVKGVVNILTRQLHKLK